MVWNSIADTVLSGKQRQQELEAEGEAEYLQWQDRLFTEIRVFIRQVNQLDLSETGDRDRFSELKRDLASKLRELRDAQQISEAPVDALIEIEELADLLTETSSKVHASVAYIGDDPFEKKRRERKRREREERRRKQAVEEKEKIAERIRSLNQSFSPPLF